MPVRNATAEWNGDLQGGKGTMKFGGGAFEGQYSFASRFEEGEGTNPEELIAAAHAGCFSMALAGALAKAGYEPQSVQTEAKVSLTKGDSGFSVTHIQLDTKANVPGIGKDEFMKIAQNAKENCPVSQALKAVDVGLNAELVS